MEQMKYLCDTFNSRYSTHVMNTSNMNDSYFKNMLSVGLHSSQQAYGASSLGSGSVSFSACPESKFKTDWLLLLPYFMKRGLMVLISSIFAEQTRVRRRGTSSRGVDWLLFERGAYFRRCMAGLLFPKHT